MEAKNKRTDAPQLPSRLVVFLGGFDPRGARHYHQLMSKEAAKQSLVSKANYEVGRRSRWSPGVVAGLQHSVWAVAQGSVPTSDYLFVDWSDLVRQHWPKHTWQVVREAMGTYGVVAKARHVLGPLQRETPYVLWTLAYPLIYMLLCMLLALGALLGVLAQQPNALGMLGGVLSASVVLLTGYKLDKLLHVSWLLRILNFSRQLAEHPVEGLDDRLGLTADLVALQLQEGHYQEVVVVGFSVGSVMVIPFVYALRARLKQKVDGPQQVQLLTLGNCIPLFTLMPQAQERLRSPLVALARDPNLFWVDISSPSDSVSFGMCNLLKLSLPQAQTETQTDGLPACVNPRHMCSPRFHKLFTASTYRWMRRNKMRMHFQYLMASELPGAYNYFELLTHRGQFMEFILKRLVR